MIRFYFPPTKLFKELIKSALYVMIVDGNNIIERGGDEEWLFNKEFTEKMGGNEKLLEAVKVIKETYESKDPYDLSEYYSIVFGSIIYSYCFSYNETRDLDPLETRGSLVKSIDYMQLVELYSLVDMYNEDKMTLLRCMPWARFIKEIVE